MGKRLGMIDKQGYAPVWSPDGGSIAYLRGKWGIGVAMLIASVDGGSPRQITENPLLSAPLRWIVPEKILYPVGETMFEWYAWDLKQNNRRALTLGAGARSAMLSPDGSQIVYEREGAEIWVNDLNRERQYRLTVGHDPIWILDGKRILYSVAERSNTLLTTFWTVNPGGSQPRAVQPREGVLATAYQWCPNMTSFVFASVKDRQDFVAIAILR
jgi:Tol biopolymer transport system component